MKGKIQVIAVSYKNNPQSFETVPSVVLIIELPEGQKIEKRVGFDPIKVKKMKDADHLVALYLIKEEEGFKVTIPW